MQNILITAKSTIASVGYEKEQIWNNYNNSKSSLTTCCFNNQDTPTGKLSAGGEHQIKNLRKDNISYRRLDKSVLLAIWASRNAVKYAGWNDMSGVAVNIGSSRGATQLFEKYHKHFLENPQMRLTPLVSPTTTLGNISSWIAYDLGIEGATLSHSITCSTALHGILNACAWLNGGMADRFLVGGSEAPLTDFTVAQMRSLGIYSKKEDAWPCSPLEEGKRENTMVLGEGSSMFSLENDNNQRALGRIIGLGFATELIDHNASLSVNADCMQKSMRMSLEDAEIDSVDVIVMHAPGTCQGDESELRAVKSVFGDNEVHLVSTKHHTGHTLGASGGLSLDLALEMIERGGVVNFPYKTSVKQRCIAPQIVMVNAVGFGGNAVSIIIQKA